MKCLNWILTALNIEVTHRRVEGKYREVALTVEDEVSSHGVENRPVTEYSQIDFSRVYRLGMVSGNKGNTQVRNSVKIHQKCFQGEFH